MVSFLDALLGCCLFLNTRSYIQVLFLSFFLFMGGIRFLNLLLVDFGGRE